LYNTFTEWRFRNPPLYVLIIGVDWGVVLGILVDHLRGKKHGSTLKELFALGHTRFRYFGAVTILKGGLAEICVNLLLPPDVFLDIGHINLKGVLMLLKRFKLR
jgi:hypothetical protein